jgi:hypothetical protein
MNKSYLFMPKFAMLLTIILLLGGVVFLEMLRKAPIYRKRLFHGLNQGKPPSRKSLNGSDHLRII